MKLICKKTCYDGGFKLRQSKEYYVEKYAIDFFIVDQVWLFSIEEVEKYFYSLEELRLLKIKQLYETSL